VFVIGAPCGTRAQSVVRMECRTRRRQPQTTGYRSAIYGSAYFNQFKDKKCFCARGYFPRGPVCSGQYSHQQWRTQGRGSNPVPLQILKKNFVTDVS